MTTIKLKVAKMSGCFISMQKNFAKCIFIVAPAMKRSSLGIAFYPKTNVICGQSATVKFTDMACIKIVLILLLFSELS